MESKTMEVDGIRMRWEEAGQGRPVIFMHGIPNPAVATRFGGRMEIHCSHPEIRLHTH